MKSDAEPAREPRMDQKRTASRQSSVSKRTQVSESDAQSNSDNKEQTAARQPLHLDLDTGNEHARFRKRWWQLWVPRDPPPPPRASLDDAPVIPMATASLLSKLTYSWITELMVLGYQRTLQASDLWKMDPTREADHLSNLLDAAWDRRVSAAAEHNARLAAGEILPPVRKRLWWKMKGKKAYDEKMAWWIAEGGTREASLAWALNDVLGGLFWIGGVFKVIGDTSQLMGPLLVKAIINFSKERAAAKAAGEPVPNIGRGVGMAIGVFCVTVMASVCQHQFFWRSMTTGVLARAALIGSIYKRGVKLTGKARSTLSTSALVNHVSTDVSRVDACAQWFHAAWTAPIQVTVCLIILLVQLGPSALAGFAFFLLIVPMQERFMAYQFRVGRVAMAWTDKRAKILHEVLGAMRVVKYFSYESPFLQRIFEIRVPELRGIRNIQFTRSANLAFAFSIPVLAATLSFVTYTATAHDFNVAIIFASLSLFQLLRQPLMFLPRALSATSDAQNALERLKHVFYAELMGEEPLLVDPAQEFALVVEDVTFGWEEIAKDKDHSKMKGKHDAHEKGNDRAKEKSALLDADAPFQLQGLNMRIPRGKLVAVVGPVGCGKSSLLQGFIGEMRRISGNVVFGGRVGYCAQTAWIQNATLRDNILFGQPYNEDRYWQAIEKSCLLPDLQALPDGDLTEIGERGINVSGGQRQRINIARALYFDAEVILMDDPLSAVDAHVGKALFEDAILGELRSSGKTVILVTHALHFLSQCDYIFTLSSDGHVGRVAEHGTYAQLIASDGVFARLDKEFGGDSHGDEEPAEDAVADQIPTSSADVLEEAKNKSDRVRRAGAGSGKLEGRLMAKEKRSTGSVSWSVYWTYFVAGRGFMLGPIIALFMILMQSSQVLNTYTLVWWQADTWHHPNSFYQVLYACLGVSQAMFTFLMGIAMDVLSFYVSQNLHHDSIKNIFYAPMSFFDTTPAGRILGVFGKDIDTIDNQLPISTRMFVLSLSNLFGAVLIITIIEHYFLIVIFFAAFGYKYFVNFYSASAREMKRLDSMLRSVLYAHFSESLTGLPTIRSYGEIARFIRDDCYYIDLEDRALILTVTNQRWLAIRIDFLGAIMVFIVALFAVVGVSGSNAAQIGLVLTYMSSLTQLCSMMTRQTAEVENYMNAVERVVHYSRGDLIPQEAPHEIEESKPPAQWPAHGAVEFRDVSMSYRPGLPTVLKGISVNIHGGEKIGVVGRTGAGKSSLMLALFRIVELSSGSISIDGIDISTIGLKDLRTKISIIPQDPLLFSGTVRSNLDPFSLYDDATLYAALRRSYLIETPSEKQELSDSLPDGNGRQSRFTLDSEIESEGTNLSVGERSLLSLARALVKDSKVVVMDEATASVDLETDGKIQRTVQTQFKDRTLLCIAHRLRTIISYDRILVLDSGMVAEFDTPLNLYVKNDSVFRGMCEAHNISLDDIQKAKALEG